MTSRIYKGAFDCWQDVAKNFNITYPEPSKVWAEYNLPNYEGYATVVFKKNRKFYYVTGSHCSCHGLEDQWEPEEYTKTELKKITGNSSDSLKKWLEAA